MRLLLLLAFCIACLAQPEPHLDPFRPGNYAYEVSGPQNVPMYVVNTGYLSHERYLDSSMMYTPMDWEPLGKTLADCEAERRTCQVPKFNSCKKGCPIVGKNPDSHCLLMCDVNSRAACDRELEDCVRNLSPLEKTRDDCELEWLDCARTMSRDHSVCINRCIGVRDPVFREDCVLDCDPRVNCERRKRECLENL